MNLSIIVPVYNSSKILKTLVKRIKKNLRTKNYEIIFIIKIVNLLLIN